jgi:hypothetical protein
MESHLMDDLITTAEMHHSRTDVTTGCISVPAATDTNFWSGVYAPSPTFRDKQVTEL